MVLGLVARQITALDRGGERVIALDVRRVWCEARVIKLRTSCRTRPTAAAAVTY